MLKLIKGAGSTLSRRWRPFACVTMTTRLQTLAVVLAIFVLTGLPAGAQQRAQPKTIAVVIGISKYEYLGGGQQLQFAARDATSFAEAIQKRGVSAQNIRVLTGSEATLAAIKSAIGNWIARTASESDTVLIFFSGHGMFERDFGEAYLLAYDSDPKDPYSTAISVSDLKQAISRRIRSGPVVVIADAVRRDFFDPESDPASAASFEQAFEQLAASRPGVSAILGSGPGEFAREGQRWGGRGVFTKHLADVLFDGADKTGNLASAAADLFDLLKGRVADDTGGKQHPWRSGGDLASLGQPVSPNRETPSITAGPTAPSNQAAKPVAEARPDHQLSGVTKPAGQPQPNRETATQTPALPAKRDTAPPAVATVRKPEPSTGATDKKIDPVRPGNAKTTVNPPTNSKAETPSSTTPTGSSTAPLNSGSKAPVTTPGKSAPLRSNPPSVEGVRNATGTSQREVIRSEIAVAESSAAPKPANNPPRTGAVSSDRPAAQPELVSTAVPTSRPDAAPSPLILKLETLITSNSLIEPRNGSAWDVYQQMTADPLTAADAARLKPMLADALAAQGRSIVTGDVRSDTVSDRVDDFKRAGQMLARARTLTPDRVDVGVLEKLSAAEALISLQFYDEAERALAQLQTAKLAAVENAFGLLYQGKLDSFRAERAFKRAIELDSKWAAPHYNLALLYRSQSNQAALTELEAAASLDSSNPALLAALGEEYFTRQQWKQSSEAYRKAVALKPNDDGLHTKLGHALYSQGLQDEANREYQKAREIRAKQ